MKNSEDGEEEESEENQSMNSVDENKSFGETEETQTS